MESVEDFWGVCLDANKKKVEWDGNSMEELEVDKDEVEQTLELRQACLGANAKEERNIVNLTATDGAGESITQSILSMKMGLHEQTQLFLTLYPPITLELVSGSGPVYISGTVTSKLMEDSEDEEDEEEDEEVEEEEEIENVSSIGKKRPADSPAQKPAKAVKVEKKDDKIAKKPVQAKGSKVKKPYEEDDGEDSDEEDDDEDDEQDSEGEEEEEEEDEIQAKPKKQQKGAGAQKKPQVTPATPKSGGGTTGTKESGKKQGKQEAMSIEDVKDKLLKTPTVPKKVDKFNNYITNSYKITDDKIKKQLWEFVQKNRPQS